MQEVRHVYNKIAETYSEAAVIYQEVGRRLLSRLEYTHLEPKVILDAGCGVGNFSQELALLYPNAEIIALDFAENMLKVGRACRNAVPILTSILADIEQLPLLSESVDLIFANQVFPHVLEISNVLAEFHRVLKPEGALYFSSLGPDSFQEIKNAWAIVDTYGHMHELGDLHHLGDALLSHQFLQPVIDMEKITLHYQTPQSILKDIKEQGGYNIHPVRRKGLMGKDAYAYLCKGLENQRNDSGKIPLTYEVVYGHAWRGENKPKYNAQTGETFIPLDMIKWRT